MKKFSIEEKAKRYDEAIERAKGMHEEGMMPERIEYIFPELKESEDERIKQFLIQEVTETSDEIMSYRNMNKKDVLAWLEKQGEHKPIDYNSIDPYFGKPVDKVKPIFNVGDKIQYSKGWTIMTIEKIENGEYIFSNNMGHTTIKSGNKWYLVEQKPADKVEPKFKVGDMISNGTSEVKIVEVNNNSYSVTNDEIENDCNPSNWVVYFKDQDNWKLFEQKSTNKVESKFKEGDWVVYENRVGIIVRILKEHYIISFDGVEEQVSFTFNDRITKWTIQDAKDGDVLVASDKSLFIYDGSINENGSVGFYIAFTEDMDIILNSDDGCGWEEKDSCHPATKEQRDTLMKAMADAGYTFDFDKKELKKIKQKPVSNQFTPEQANILDKHIDKFLEQKKSAWSEEDEQYFNFLEKLLNNLQVKSTENEIKKGTNSNSEYYFKIIQWLKFLKDRVQLKQEWSEEDARNIQDIDSVLFYDKNLPEDTCIRLRNWLKSLKTQNTWKPSEKQMQALNAINVTGGVSYTEQGQELINLYNDLKKLREE